jgi:hypothetical protein
MYAVGVLDSLFPHWKTEIISGGIYMREDTLHHFLDRLALPWKMDKMVSESTHGTPK